MSFSHWNNQNTQIGLFGIPFTLFAEFYCAFRRGNNYKLNDFFGTLGFQSNFSGAKLGFYQLFTGFYRILLRTRWRDKGYLLSSGPAGENYPLKADCFFHPKGARLNPEILSFDDPEVSESKRTRPWSEVMVSDEPNARWPPT